MWCLVWLGGVLGGRWRLGGAGGGCGRRLKRPAGRGDARVGLWGQVGRRRRRAVGAHDFFSVLAGVFSAPHVLCLAHPTPTEGQSNCVLTMCAVSSSCRDFISVARDVATRIGHRRTYCNARRERKRERTARTHARTRRRGPMKPSDRETNLLRAVCIYIDLSRWIHRATHCRSSGVVRECATKELAAVQTVILQRLSTSRRCPTAGSRFAYDARRVARGLLGAGPRCHRAACTLRVNEWRALEVQLGMEHESGRR